jgi:hypothetical protein
MERRFVKGVDSAHAHSAGVVLREGAGASVENLVTTIMLTCVMSSSQVAVQERCYVKTGKPTL